MLGYTRIRRAMKIFWGRFCANVKADELSGRSFAAADRWVGFEQLEPRLLLSGGPLDELGPVDTLNVLGQYEMPTLEEMEPGYTSSNKSNIIETVEESSTDKSNSLLGIPDKANGSSLVDLVVTDATSPGTAALHETIEISWTVTNQGTESTNVSEWDDGVFISDDTILDDNDRRVEYKYIYDESVAPGGSYTITEQFTVPNTVTGSVYLLFATDTADDQPESDDSNNTLAVLIELQQNPGCQS